MLIALSSNTLAGLERRQSILDLVNQAISEDRPPRGMWHRALWYADRTPESRNRYVDFLRALSILAVVLGHWLISAPYF